MIHDLVHGGGLAAMRSAFPDAPTPWLDLSTGVNPWPYPCDAIPPCAFARLPESDLEARAAAAAADYLGCPASSIALTPGSQAAIQILPLLLTVHRVAIISPTYAEHADLWRRAGAHVEETTHLPEPDAFNCVVVVNPNNPNGRRFEPERLRQFADGQSKSGGALIVDEAFADLAPDISTVARAHAPGLIVLRSFGKFFGLAGLRLGMLIAEPQLVARAKARLGPWAVSGPALNIAARAYRDTDWHQQMRARLQRAAQHLDGILVDGGLRVLGGTDLFRWVEARDAHALWRLLATKGIYVRRFSWSDKRLRFGLPADLTASVRLAEALRDAR
jgi:cobalamin biosynthetic protein CobC